MKTLAGTTSDLNVTVRAHAASDPTIRLDAIAYHDDKRAGFHSWTHYDGSVMDCYYNGIKRAYVVRHKIALKSDEDEAGREEVSHYLVFTCAGEFTAYGEADRALNMVKLYCEANWGPATLAGAADGA